MAVKFGSPEAQEILEQDKVRGYLAITPDVEMVECLDCNGKGYVNTECDECGSLYDQDCATCDCEGEISKEKFRKLDAERNGNNVYTAREKLNNWNAGKPLLA